MPCNRERQSCTICPSRTLAVWDELERSAQKCLDLAKRDLTLEPGKVLYHQGGDCVGLFCLRDGLIGERQVDRDGHSALTRLHRPGSLIGYQEFFSKMAYTHSAEALKKSHVCFIDSTTINEIVSSSTRLTQKIFIRALKEKKILEEELFVLKTSSNKIRFIQVLLMFYDNDSVVDEQNRHVINIPIARQDIAALIGVAPETLSRIIREIKKEGNIKFDGKVARISNIKDMLSILKSTID